MRKLLLALVIFLTSLCAAPAQMMQDIVNASTAGGTLTPCTTTTQYDVSSTPAGCNLVLFNQGRLP